MKSVIKIALPAFIAVVIMMLAATASIDTFASSEDEFAGGSGPSSEAGASREVRSIQPIIDSEEEPMSTQGNTITPNSTVDEIKGLAEFDGFARLLFPVDRSVYGSETLNDLATNGTFVWYSNIKADAFANELEALRSEAASGDQIFYPIYTDEEMKADPSLADTGLFFFRGDPGAPFAIVNAGGGFAYVAALHDSFPVAFELSKSGYNAFALIYRVDHPYEDLARAIEFVHDHAAELGVDPNGYSLWGGSAGARMAAALGNRSALLQLTGRTDITQASTVITQYTGLSSAYSDDAPTYACVGTNDGIANWQTMQRRLHTLAQMGIPSEFHEYEGLTHGFGLGTGTVAEGWIDDAMRFWEENRVRGE